MNIIFSEIPFHISRILSANLYIPAEPVLDTAEFLTCDYIIWITCQKIHGCEKLHTSHFILRIDLVSQPDRRGACHKLMVKALETKLRNIHLMHKIFCALI